MGIELARASRVVGSTARDTVPPGNASFSIRFLPLPDGGVSFDTAYRTFRKQANELAKELGIGLHLEQSAISRLGYGVEGQLTQKRGGTTGLGSALDGMLSLHMPGHRQMHAMGHLEGSRSPAIPR